MKNIQTVDDVKQVLDQEGYETIATENSVITKIGSTNGLPAVFSVDENHLKINCQVATLGDIPESQVANACLYALSLNTVINPFAFALIDVTDDPNLENPEDYKIILTDKIPLGDLSKEELVSAVNSLWTAVAESKRVLSAVS